EGLRTRRAELFSELLAITERVGEFFADAHTVKMATLAREREEVRVQAREAIERYAALEVELGPIDGLLRRRQSESSKARVQLYALSESKPGPEQYPSAGEIRAWEQRVAKAQAALDSA